MSRVIDGLSPNLSRGRRVSKPALRSAGGIVVSQNRLASQIGARVLRDGGHAADAAVATAFALGVVEPWMSGIGGVGGALVYDAGSRQVTALDFGGCSPAALDPRDFPLAEERSDLLGWPLVKDGRNVVGPLAAVVPGVPAGLDCLHRMFGCKKWGDLLAPAIRLAEDGLVVDWYTTLIVATAFRDLVKDPAARARFLPGGAPPVPAFATAPEPVTRLPMPELARTLRALAEDGSGTFYRGALGRALADEMREMGGCISASDLSSYRVKVTPPLEIAYRDCVIHVLPELNGGPTLALGYADLRRQQMGTSPGRDTVLAHVAALTTAWTDRLRRMGDAGERSVPTSTTHLCVVDRAGNVVTLTATLLALFGARVMLPQTGILMNNGITWFDPRPGGPNSIAPGRRVLANYSPAVMTRGAEVIGIGGSGGRRILPAVFQLLAMCADFGFDLEQAFRQPRIDVSVGGRVVVGRDTTPETIAALAKTHDVVVAEPVVYSTPYAFANAVRRVGNINEAASDAEQPCAEAVSEEDV